ncbi:MAG: elongation factor G [Pirellulaceae bacterium]|jgi:elongation factor G|nr:elongation factor G [Thermoguttaceae bacterium]MDI9442823.1 elongation factor G [Planctomycetota bacterium]NLY99582.1 elongation factor G [Pirellulaceae bacterium]
MRNSLTNLRNIGISAHIDSGKTTLSERILYYAGRIHRVQEVRGEGATMDHMDLEKERGITITSAATTVQWKAARINLIDTPGHVDFTVEVERSLRVLDGAVLVLCAVGGVQAQSITIDRQMHRYHIPRVAFINKMDRTGANPDAVVRQLRDKLGCDAMLMQRPIGSEARFAGVVDLVTRKALYFDGPLGEQVRIEDVPPSMEEEVRRSRQELLEALAMYSDELMELLLAEEEVPEAMIHAVVRSAVQGEQFTPVFLGTAYRNKGVQALLDAVVQYLPSPLDCESQALVHGQTEAKIRLEPSPDKPTVAMAFKIVEDPYGALTFMRIYQGRLAKGETYFNQRTGRKERFSRIVRMHADEREDIDEALAGDIVAVLGVDCASGDTYAAEYPYCTLQSMFVPEPVIQIAIAPADRGGAERLAKALHRFRREDPTLRVSTDEETGETLLAGMGELHLEVYVERIRREHRVLVAVGPPKVNYREAPTQEARFDVRHKKQSGGAGQFAHIVGRLLPLDPSQEEAFLFEDCVTGGRIPRQYIPAVEKGFRQGIVKGPVAGYPVVGLHVVLEDGSYHEVDSSDLAFQICAATTMRETFSKTRPVLLEPVMNIEIECPSDFQGAVVGDLTGRRGMVTATSASGPTARIEGEVPLSETFGYSTDLRSMTQGQGTFSLEFARYRRLPPSIEREVIAIRKKGSMVGAV